MICKKYISLKEKYIITITNKRVNSLFGHSCLPLSGQKCHNAAMRPVAEYAKKKAK